MAAASILLVSEDRELADALAGALARHDLSLVRQTVGNGVACAEGACSVVVVDAAAIPAVQPVVVDLRRRSNVPVLVISADAAPTDSVTLLDHGADDCVGRAVDQEHLVARIRALLRRSGPLDAGRTVIHVGDLRIDPAARRVSVCGEDVGCTSMEYDILEYLGRRAGRPVSRDELCSAACGRSASPLDRAIDVHISHLRRKLRLHGLRVVTVRGVGYLLEPLERRQRVER